jgi:hypothetical protein
MAINSGLAIKIAKHRARERATLILFLLNKNSLVISLAET